MKLNCFIARKGDKFTVEVEPAATILDLKVKVQNEKGYSAERQILMLDGPEFLKNTQNLAEAGIKEGDLIIVGLSTKLNIKNETEGLDDIVASGSGSKGKAVDLEASSSSSSRPDDIITVGLASSPATLYDTPENVESSAEYQTAVQALVGMGFAPGDVVCAMRAAYNDPDRAAEYLMTGIPNVDAHLPAQIKGKESFSIPKRGKKNKGKQPALFDEADDDENWQRDMARREYLLGHPIMNTLKELIFDSKEEYEPCLADLHNKQPELIDGIMDNPDIFIKAMLGNALDRDSDTGIPDSEDYDIDQSGVASGSTSSATNPIRQSRKRKKSADEEEALDRLAALGFDRDHAADVLAACDGDEEKAANLLFEMMVS
ncbi:hypothetical protein BC829DRAFT_441165 [Chytridium lagenaria]|nr:hypothetical protein BC829DRAFT_441165 [Chytridium lagenaria]